MVRGRAALVLVLAVLLAGCAGGGGGERAMVLRVPCAGAVRAVP